MKFPVTKDRSTQDAAEFWWERHVARLMKRRLMSRNEWQRVMKLLQSEKPTLRKVLA